MTRAVNAAISETSFKGFFFNVALDISFILFCINKQTSSVVHVVFLNGVWLLHYSLIFQLRSKRHYGLDSFSLFLILRIGFCWYIPTNYFVMFHFYHCGKWHVTILIFINRCQLIVWWTIGYHNYHSSISTLIIALYECSCFYIPGSFHFENRLPHIDDNSSF